MIEKYWDVLTFFYSKDPALYKKQAIKNILKEAKALETKAVKLREMAEKIKLIGIEHG